jgi:hypothetical protein
VDITDPAGRQYPGWPHTITQFDNYARKPVAWLPTIRVQPQSDPVLQVIEEANREIVYTVRINGNEFRPKVFAEGSYTVRVGEGSLRKEFKGVKTMPAEQTSVLKVVLQP